MGLSWHKCISLQTPGTNRGPALPPPCWGGFSASACCNLQFNVSNRSLCAYLCSCPGPNTPVYVLSKCT